MRGLRGMMPIFIMMMCFCGMIVMLFLLMQSGVLANYGIGIPGMGAGQGGSPYPAFPATGSSSGPSSYSPSSSQPGRPLSQPSGSGGQQGQPSQSSQPNQPSGPLKVIVYDSDEFEDELAQMEPGNYLDLDDTKYGDLGDDIESMKIPRGLSVTLYEHEDYEGDAWPFTSGDHGDLDDASDDSMSMKIVKR